MEITKGNFNSHNVYIANTGKIFSGATLYTQIELKSQRVTS